ncbi:MAG: hypothetical protein ACLUJR_13865 [Mediterraneibacter gnavus]
MAEERIGRECAAVHNRLIRYQCMLEMLKKPLFPHAYKMYRLYWDTLMKQMTLEEGVSLVMKQLKEQGVYVGILYEYDSRDPISENRKARNHQMDRWCCYQ